MPERIRILFIGELNSSHFHNWLTLLKPCLNEFQIAGIQVDSLDPGCPGLPFHFAASPEPLPGSERFPLHYDPRHEDWSGYISPYPLLTATSLQNTAQYLHDFRPHIVHTLGLFPGSLYYLHYLRSVRPTLLPIWLIQARGGPDIALNKHNRHLAGLIEEMLHRCDCFLADNAQSYQFALELGLTAEKLSPTGPVPGTGGIDINQLDQPLPPSLKEKSILWPKAYFNIQSDGLPVACALATVFEQLPEVRLIATAATPEVEFWLRRFLEPYLDRVDIRQRLPYPEMVDLYKRVRLLLAPSLSDGIPNSMYEAMASGTVPVLSPITTIATLFEADRHVLYADNLVPEEISQAVIRGMTDDALADHIAATNRAWVPALAGKDYMREKVLPLYTHLASQGRDMLMLEWNRLEQQNKVFQDHLKELEDQNRVLLEQRNTQEKEHKTLQEKNKLLEERHSMLLQLHYTVLEQHATLQKQNEALQEQNDSLREQNVALREQNDSLREQNVALREQSVALKELNAAQTTQLENNHRIISHPIVAFPLKLARLARFHRVD